MLSFENKLALFVEIYNIPLEEHWGEYLQNNYKNYFAYMNSLGIATKEGKGGNYELTKIKINKNLVDYFKELEGYYNIKTIKEKSIIDVGCGWGFLSFWFLLSGAEKVYAVGFDYQIEFINKLKKVINEKNILPDIDKLIAIAKPLEKNIETIARLEKEKVDLIIYNEVFEHIPDDIFDDALIASYNTLKRNGKLLSVTHNTDNPIVVNRLKNYWDSLEREYLISKRKKLIMEKITDINIEDLEQLALSTRGYMQKEFKSAIDNFKQNKKIPLEEKIMPAVDLDYDYICENYISPEKVLIKMNKAGFKSYCYPALQRGRRYIPFRPFVKIFHKLFMSFDYFSKAVVFVGIKV